MYIAYINRFFSTKHYDRAMLCRVFEERNYADFVKFMKVQWLSNKTREIFEKQCQQYNIFSGAHANPVISKAKVKRDVWEVFTYLYSLYLPSRKKL